MSFETQSAEFDALQELIKDWNCQPAIVDDFYPEWRHGFEGRLQSFFEGRLQSFFEACEANGRFAPNSRFGSRLPSVALLRECMEKFRFYQGQHEQKADEAHLADNFNRESDARAKAEVNKGIANRIERFLKNEK